jgi:hypothetical protein
VFTQADRAGVGLDHAAGHAEGRRLAGAVRAQETHDFARVDLKAHSVHYAAAAVILDETIDN